MCLSSRWRPKAESQVETKTHLVPSHSSPRLFDLEGLKTEAVLILPPSHSASNLQWISDKMKQNMCLSKVSLEWKGRNGGRNSPSPASFHTHHSFQPLLWGLQAGGVVCWGGFVDSAGFAEATSVNLPSIQQIRSPASGNCWQPVK